MEKVRKIVGPTILLRSGTYFDFEAPHLSDFTIGDIAHSLAKTCRFTGQCHTFYSVAEHSVHASNIVPPKDAFAALMHDAAEAFVGDVAKPLKNLLPDYSVIEDRVEREVFKRFDVPLPLPPSVKLADLHLLRTEQSQAMGNNDELLDISGLDSDAVRLQFWCPIEAAKRFLLRFDQLLAARSEGNEG